MKMMLSVKTKCQFTKTKQKTEMMKKNLRGCASHFWASAALKNKTQNDKPEYYYCKNNTTCSSS